MEGTNKKRGRENDKKSCAEKSTKRHDLNHNGDNNSINFEDKNNSSSNNYNNDTDNFAKDSSWEGYVALGVFDFPWLHESMISTSLDWSFPDAFFPFLDNDGCAATTPIYEKFEENKVVWPLRGDGGLELEGVECIWSSLFTQQQHQHNV